MMTEIDLMAQNYEEHKPTVVNPMVNSTPRSAKFDCMTIQVRRFSLNQNFIFVKGAPHFEVCMRLFRKNNNY